jgi:hypothetical protein
MKQALYAHMNNKRKMKKKGVLRKKQNKTKQKKNFSPGNSLLEMW